MAEELEHVVLAAGEGGAVAVQGGDAVAQGGDVVAQGGTAATGQQQRGAMRWTSVTSSFVN